MAPRKKQQPSPFNPLYTLLFAVLAVGGLADPLYSHGSAVAMEHLQNSWLEALALLLLLGLALGSLSASRPFHSARWFAFFSLEAFHYGALWGGPGFNWGGTLVAVSAWILSGSFRGSKNA